MKPHQFHAKYANTPLSGRFAILNFSKYGDLTLDELFQKVEDLENVIRPYQIKLDYLMKIADEYYSK